MRKPLKWAIGLLILSLPLVAAAWIFVAMNGGISSILLNLKSRPDLDSPELKRDRTKLEQQIDAAFSREIPSHGFFHVRMGSRSISVGRNEVRRVYSI
jgi:hypothetical protein